ncbi:Arf8p [Salvia divinorum]|uniref:Arf8p n=1 Tax=Salvia divinorum TaxID=28513 RepID=A0ABD1IFX4_SALDI
MLAGGGLQNQLMQFQQPVHYLSSTGSHNPVTQLQHRPQSLVSPHMLPSQSQMLTDNLQRPLEQQIHNQAEKREQEHTYQEAYFAQHNQLQQRPMFDIPSSSLSKPDFATSNNKFPPSTAHSTMQNILSSIGPEGSGNLLNFSSIGEPVLNEQSPQQSWMSRFTQKDACLELESGSLDVQTHALFGANIDSSAILMPTTASVGTVHADIQPGPSGYQNPLYGCVQDSSDVLQTTGELDQPTDTRAFVKMLVYKTGSVTGHHPVQQLSRTEKGTGENDVLLLGDDQWEAFVNNVWMSNADNTQNCLWTPISRIA